MRDPCIIRAKYKTSVQILSYPCTSVHIRAWPCISMHFCISSLLYMTVSTRFFVIFFYEFEANNNHDLYRERLPSSKRGTNSERPFSKHIYGQLPTTKVRWLNYTPYISFKYLLGTNFLIQISRCRKNEDLKAKTVSSHGSAACERKRRA